MGSIPDAINTTAPRQWGNGTPAQNGRHSIVKRGPRAHAKSWDHRFSQESLAQGPSPLKESAKTLDGVSSIQLGAARPNAQFYPWQAMSAFATNDAAQGLDVTMECAKGEGPSFDLSTALNYGLAAGSPELVEFFKSHVRSVHNPYYMDWETCLSCGSTAAIDIVLRMFCDRGDWILTEQFTYAQTMLAAKNKGLKLCSIRMDQHGLDPEDLDYQLTNWDTAQRGKKPFLLYTIPSGQNPTGATQPTERKQAVYQVAEKHDLLIVEDDPYYLFALDMDENATMEQYVKSLPTSYLSLDESGRVLRLESASKILAPGLRSGWVTGCAQLIDLYVSYADISTSAPSGPSQVMLVKLLPDTWGQAGLLNWTKQLALHYKTRRDIVLRACDEHFPKEICEWTRPNVGMFLWVKVDITKHPSWSSVSADEEARREFCLNIEDKINEAAEERGVITAKGSWFVVDTPSEELYVRLSYVTAPQEALGEAVEKFGKTLASEFGL